MNTIRKRQKKAEQGIGLWGGNHGGDIFAVQRPAESHALLNLPEPGFAFKRKLLQKPESLWKVLGTERDFRLSRCGDRISCLTAVEGYLCLYSFIEFRKRSNSKKDNDSVLV